MKLLVLAGGFGTRLQSVLNGSPKPLANINGQPFIKFLFKDWINNGFFVGNSHENLDKEIHYLKTVLDTYS